MSFFVCYSFALNIVSFFQSVNFFFYFLVCPLLTLVDLRKLDRKRDFENRIVEVERFMKNLKDHPPFLKKILNLGKEQDIEKKIFTNLCRAIVELYDKSSSAENLVTQLSKLYKKN